MRVNKLEQDYIFDEIVKTLRTLTTETSSKSPDMFTSEKQIYTLIV